MATLLALLACVALVALQLRCSNTMRNNMAAQFESTLGASARVKFYTNGVVGTLGGSEAGNTLIATVVCPADWLVPHGSLAGVVVLNGSWTITTVAVGTIGHAVIETSGGTVHADATVTDQAGNGDFKASQQTSTFIGQQITVTAFQLTMGAPA